MKTRRLVLAVVMAGLVLAGSVGSVWAATQADLDNVNRQLSEVRSKISGYEKEMKSLAAQADTLTNKIATLKAEENVLVAQIELKQAEHDKLVIEIEATEKRIHDNSEMIGYIVAQYYYNDEVSTIERLASSGNLSDFIDEEARLSNLSDNLSGIVTENKALKEELEVQRQEVERVLADLEAQKAALADKRAEQQRLLDDTRGMESEYQAMKSTANAEKERLEELQQQVLQELERSKSKSGAQAGDPNKGGYPWSSQCPWAKWNKKQYGDDWGMYICECVSYTAWKVEQYYGNMPYWGGYGNANQWLANAKAAGIPTGTTPKAGSVGVSNSGPYGHVVWVEYLIGDGSTIHISQYNSANVATNWRSGEYSEIDIEYTAYSGYIYFGEW